MCNTNRIWQIISSSKCRQNLREEFVRRIHATSKSCRSSVTENDISYLWRWRICTHVFPDTLKQLFKQREAHLKYQQCTVTSWYEHNLINFYYRYFFVLKHCIVIGLCEVAENFCTAIFGCDLTYFHLIQNPHRKNIIIRYRNDSNKAQCFICKKTHPFISWQFVEIYNSLNVAQNFWRVLYYIGGM